MNYESVKQMKTLVSDIRGASGIEQIEAEQALGAVFEFLSARLPSPVMGRIRDAISDYGPTKELGNAH
ncbi:MAG: hypothetical protein ABI705_09700 [Aestuariivirga sp.]